VSSTEEHLHKCWSMRNSRNLYIQNHYSVEVLRAYISNVHTRKKRYFMMKNKTKCFNITIGIGIEIGFQKNRHRLIFILHPTFWGRLRNMNIVHRWSLPRRGQRRRSPPRADQEDYNATRTWMTNRRFGKRYRFGHGERSQRSVGRVRVTWPEREERGKEAVVLAAIRCEYFRTVVVVNGTRRERQFYSVHCRAGVFSRYVLSGNMEIHVRTSTRSAGRVLFLRAFDFDARGNRIRSSGRVVVVRGRSASNDVVVTLRRSTGARHSPEKYERNGIGIS